SGLCLLAEAREIGGVVAGLVEDLDRDAPLQIALLCFVHGAHAAGSEEPKHLVPTAEHTTEKRHWRGA
ncbi:hypothetical protein LLE87_31930, partial [Paenibacillus polymyxa]|nr:hypothetical protein [Paenibacillus polymyxa]